MTKPATAALRLPPRLLTAAFLLMAGICLVGLWLPSAEIRLATKWVPVTLLAFWLWGERRDGAGRLAVAGLLFSAFGDATLEGIYIAPESGMPWFVIGLGGFLLAHLCYIGMYLRLRQQPRYWPLLAMGAYAAALLALLWHPLGEMKLPVLLYVSVIVLMVWRASSLSLESLPAGVWRWCPVWGAVLFAASDSMIAINRFLIPFEGARLLILLTYWLAQFGIAVAAANLPRR